MLSASHRPDPDNGEGHSSMPHETHTAGPLIELAAPSSSGLLAPSPEEQAKFLARSESVLKDKTTSLGTLTALTREALGLKTRLEGDGAGGERGVLTSLESRLERYQQAARVLTETPSVLAVLYQHAPTTVIQTMVTDFLSRLGSQVPRLGEPHAATSIASCLEQSRLMMIFAARALKSEDHVQQAIGGLKERSYTDSPDASSPKGPAERSPTDRQAAFEARRVERAAATEARKEALKNGGSLPVRGAKANPAPVESEKTEILTAVAGQHRASFDSARPTEQQRRQLTQRSPKELERAFADRLTSPKGEARANELESIRTEVSNALISRLTDWLRAELDIAKSLGQQSLRPGDIPVTAEAAKARLSQAQREMETLRGFKESVQQYLLVFARAILKHQDKCRSAFNPNEWAALERIVNPEKPKETYELAD